MKKLFIRNQGTRHLVRYIGKFVISGFVTQGLNCISNVTILYGLPSGYPGSRASISSLSSLFDVVF